MECSSDSAAKISVKYSEFQINVRSLTISLSIEHELKLYPHHKQQMNDRGKKTTRKIFRILSREKCQQQKHFHFVFFCAHLSLRRCCREQKQEFLELHNLWNAWWWGDEGPTVRERTAHKTNGKCIFIIWTGMRNSKEKYENKFFIQRRAFRLFDPIFFSCSTYFRKENVLKFSRKVMEIFARHCIANHTKCWLVQYQKPS